MSTLSYADYDRIEAVRASRLKRMAQSPLHYRDAHDSDTAERGFLRAIHCLILQPDRYGEQFAVFDGKVRRGKAFDAFEAEHAGKTILSPREHKQAGRVAQALFNHPVAGAWLDAQGPTEETLEWTHPDTGLKCKARLDKLAVPSVIVDAKGYGSSDPRIIGRRVAQLGCHVQAAHYCEGLSIARGVPLAEVRFLVVSYELVPPFDVAVVELEHDNGLALGRSERDRLMARLAECLATNTWPGRCPELVPLELPAWADPLLDGSDHIKSSDDDEDFEE